MADRNAEIAAMLRELAQLTVLDDQNPQSFRARAYENAMHAVQASTVDLAALSVAELQEIQGIGKATATKIRQYLETGKVTKLEELRGRFPPAIVELSKIPGMGPKTLARLREELGIEDLAGLKAAIAGQKLRTLSGLGAKSEEKLAKAIERLGLKEGEKRTPIAEAMRVAHQIEQGLAALPQVGRVEVCGSLRRQCETIGDIDIVVASTAPGPIMAWFAAHPLAREVLVAGDTKTSVVTHAGLQVDLRVVEPDAFGAAVMYFTGSKSHNIRLRQRALGRGMTLNEYALTRLDGGEVVASRSEEEIYAALGLPWIPAPMREDTGEVEAAESGALPRALQPTDLLGDLHVHTDLSGDGRSPLDVMLAEGARRGYRYMAITDHAENLAINGVSREQLLRQAEQMAALGERFPTMHLLRGAELNIGADGGLDYDPDFRASLDWCVAAVHSHFDLPQATQTRRLIKAMEDPSVKVIGHLTGRMIGSRPGIEIDVDEVLAALVAHGVALEINSALPRLDAAAPVLRKARELGVVFVVSTDAHHVTELDRTRWGARQAQRGWIAPEQVANTWSPERFFGWLRRQG